MVDISHSTVKSRSGPNWYADVLFELRHWKARTCGGGGGAAARDGGVVRGEACLVDLHGG